MKRIAIIVDRLDSGLGIAALGRAELDPNIDVIAALKHPTLRSLLNKLEAGDYRDLLFSWRYLLEEIYNSKFSKKAVSELFEKSRVGVLIPDYQGIDCSSLKLSIREFNLLKRVDFYHVTNLDLAKKYQIAFPSDHFAGVLHDVTSRRKISETRTRNIVKKQQIIWIGNSKWGTRAGYNDYKGFERVIKPLVKKIQDSVLNYDVEIIDLAIKKISHQQVLRKIAESRILILASDYEGTGLPILEALGLDTYVITTNVGIAPEIFSDLNFGTIVEQEVDAFFCEIVEYQSNNRAKSDIGKSAFEKYMSSAESEHINPNKFNGGHLDPLSERRSAPRVSDLIWFLRFLINLK